VRGDGGSTLSAQRDERTLLERHSGFGREAQARVAEPGLLSDGITIFFGGVCFLFRMLRRLGILIENSHEVFLTRQADRSAQSLACFFVVVLHVSVHVLRPRISLRRATCRQDPSFLVSIVPFRIGTSARVPVEDERVAHAAAVAGAAV
jgi:hypothetical protein